MVSGIPNIINSLSDDLKDRVEAVILLTEQLEETQTKLDLAKRDLKRVKIALEALSGNEIPIPESADSKAGSILYSSGDPSHDTPIVPVPVPLSVQAPRIPTGPTCDACGGELIYTSRRLNNGKQVTLWACRECRNERF